MQTCYIRNSGVFLDRPRIIFQVEITAEKLGNCLHDEGVWRGCVSVLCCPMHYHKVALMSQSSQLTRPLVPPLAEQLQQKDQQILLLLEEKEMIFRDMTECSTPLPEDCSPTHSSRILFRSNTEEALKGGPLMKSAINEGNLHSASPTLFLFPRWFTY